MKNSLLCSKNSNHVLIPPNWNYIKDILQTNPNNSPEILLTYVLTWNIHGKTPNSSEMELIIPTNKQFQLYIINTQECLRSIGASFVNSTKDKWVEILKKHLGENYINIANNTLSAFHIAIFCHKSISKNISHIYVGCVKTGFMNVMANKGAVAISFVYKKKKFLFINSHLSSGQENSKDRNKDFERINRELVLEPYEETSNNNNNNEQDSQENNKEETENNFDASKIKAENGTITDRFDIVIWGGDFNYRINLPKTEVIQAIKNKKIEFLREHDQLLNEINNQSINFNNFDEGLIHFNPTYKFKDNKTEDSQTPLNDEYDEERIPGWCDRIIYKAKRISDVLLCQYKSIPKTKTSDHKPVFAVFKIEIGDKYERVKIAATKTQETAACLIC